MNITLRKLALLEQNIVKQEEAAKLQGYVTDTIDADLKERVNSLLNKIRTI